MPLKLEWVRHEHQCNLHRPELPDNPAESKVDDPRLLANRDLSWLRFLSRSASKALTPATPCWIGFGLRESRRPSLTNFS